MKRFKCAAYRFLSEFERNLFRELGINCLQQSINGLRRVRYGAGCITVAVIDLQETSQLRARTVMALSMVQMDGPRDWFAGLLAHRKAAGT
jgi:hypothetical protein